MFIKIRPFFVRNAEAGELLEMFLVAAVSSVIGIRFYLTLTGYPQLGGESLHIAHVLWGGGLMLVALVLLLTFLDRKARFAAAFLGGLGFGAFIDELGKFITQNNDYFFQPAIAFIHIIFVLLFLLFRYLGDEHQLSKQEAYANSLDIARESIASRLDKFQVQEALAFLKESDASDALSRSLNAYFKRYKASARPRHNPYEKIKEFIHLWYDKAVDYPWFFWAVVGVVTFNAIAVFAQAGMFVADLQRYIAGIEPEELSLIEGVEILFSLFSAIFIVRGIIYLRSSRIRAYQMFRYAILLSIFVTHFFIFFQEQFSAIIGFISTLLVLLALNYLIQEEKGREEGK